MDKAMEISMYKAAPTLLTIFYFYHGTGKSTEISMCKAGANLLLVLFGDRNQTRNTLDRKHNWMI